MLRLVLSAVVALGLLPAAAQAHHPGRGAAAGGAPGLAHHGDVLPPAADRALERAAARRALATPRAATVSELAPTWCGAVTSVDDTAHASSAGARFKVVYASPSDQADRFATMGDVIQGDARAISALVADTAQGTRTVRFDTGTECGPQYLDIISVRLPRTRAAYMAEDVAARTARLRTDLAPALATVPGVRNALVYADHLYGGDGVAGYASFYLDERPGAGNSANRGGLYAFVFGTGTDAFISPRRTTVLHEMAHTIGAVQDGAPHATGEGHCTDEYDVLCYADGGPSNAMTYDCGSPTQSLFDCGADDYFAVAPPAGSYLATHWNVYQSAFLCPVGACVQGATPVSTTGFGPLLDEAPPAGAGPPAADLPIADVPPADDPAPAAPAAPTDAERARDAVRATRDGVRSALRRHGLRALRAAFAAPAAGRVQIAVTRRGRRVAGGERRVTAGTARIAVRLTRRGRRLARSAARTTLAVAVRFAPVRGTPVQAGGSAVAARR